MDGNSEITVVLALGTGGMLVLVSFIVLFVVIYQRRMQAKKQEMAELELQSQKEMMEAVIVAKEKEQKRVAQELHDGIGSALTALKMSLIRMEMEKKDKQEIGDSIKHICNDVRRISNELMPSDLEDMGFITALETLVIKLNHQSNVQFTYESELPEGYHFSEQEDLALYRVVQELLNNIIKHADAEHVQIIDKLDVKGYILTICDDGSGFVPVEKELGETDTLGLKNIQSRIQHVKGNLTYALNRPKGTMITIELPTDEEEH